MQEYDVQDISWWEVAMVIMGLAALAISLAVQHSVPLSFLGVTMVGLGVVSAVFQVYIKSTRRNDLKREKRQKLRRDMLSFIRSMVLLLPLLLINSLTINGPLSPGLGCPLTIIWIGGLVWYWRLQRKQRTNT
jgi:uncharacterized membrane protein YqgA involved in biofilm formation